MITFFKNFFHNPSQIGSIVPSSRFLAGSMTKWLHDESIHTICEFGAGTGVITKAILKRKPQRAKLYSFELSAELAKELHKFDAENYKVVIGDVRNMLDIISEGTVDIIISSLPFASMPKEITEEILLVAGKALRKGGKFIQYQYFMQNKSDVERHFNMQSTHLQVLNIPPAFIYHASKK